MSGWYNRSKRFENLTLSANRLDTAASSLYPTKFALRKSLASMMLTYYEFHSLLTNSNLSTSNIPISVIFNLGITGNAIKLRLINGSILAGTPCP